MLLPATLLVEAERCIHSCRMLRRLPANMLLHLVRLVPPGRPLRRGGRRALHLLSLQLPTRRHTRPSRRRSCTHRRPRLQLIPAGFRGRLSPRTTRALLFACDFVSLC